MVTKAAGAVVSGTDEPRPTTIIKVPSAWPGLGLAEFWRYRSIAVVLARRALMVRYRQSVIGVGWAVLQPFLQMLVFTIFFGVLARIPSNGVPYPVFFFSGLVIWQMVNKIFVEGSGSVVANAALVGRVYFPRAYFPTSVALASLVDLVASLVALVVLLAIYGVLPGAEVVMAPVLLAVAWITALGVSLWLSALNAAYRDVSQLLPFLAQLWLFASPVIYPSSIVPERFLWLYFLNPIALAVEGFRSVVTHSPAPPAVAWIGVPIAFLVLIIGYISFRRREPTFADVV